MCFFKKLTHVYYTIIHIFNGSLRRDVNNPTDKNLEYVLTKYEFLNVNNL